MDIVGSALKLFSTHGIRAVSKQDIQNEAHEILNLPKDEIIEQCVQNISDNIKKIVPEAHDESLSPTDQIMAIYSKMLHYMLNFNLAFFNDLKKYHSKHFEDLLQVLDDTVYDEVKRLLRKGKAQGNLLFWIDVDLECTIHKTMLNHIITEFNFQTNDYTIEQVYTQIFTVRFKGIEANANISN